MKLKVRCFGCGGGKAPVFNAKLVKLEETNVVFNYECLLWRWTVSCDKLKITSFVLWNLAAQGGMNDRYTTHVEAII